MHRRPIAGMYLPCALCWLGVREGEGADFGNVMQGVLV